MKKIKFILPFLVLIFSASALHFVYASQGGIESRVLGKILLQVESRGEAWYVNPQDARRHSLGSPAAAFSVMRAAGIGITNENLRKIPVADFNLGSSLDSDGDGLSDAVERSFGTSVDKADTDGDGYDDKTEVINNYNPLGLGRLPIDLNFSRAQAGRIFLQVESKGEAWYVNPNNYKRYYLGMPADALATMRHLGLGITNSDLNKLVLASSQHTESTPAPAAPSAPAGPVIVDGVIDCGTSFGDQEQFYIESGDENLLMVDYRQDAAVSCMGEALLNNCHPAKFLRLSNDGWSRTEEIVGKDGDSCTFRITYGSISDSENPMKPYENSNMQCKYNRSLFDDGCYLLPNDVCSNLGFKNAPGSIYGNTLAELEQAAFLEPDSVDCSGTIFDRLGDY